MEYATRASARCGRRPKCALTSDEDDADFWGSAHEAEGLFTPPPEEDAARRVRLAGCLPRGGLLRSVDHVGGRRALAGKAWLDLLDADGAAMGSYFVDEVTVIDVEPSGRGVGLVDLTVTLRCEDALAGAGPVWDLIRLGHLSRTGLWRDLAPEGTRAWLSVALRSSRYRRRGKPAVPAGHVFTVDGRGIVDRDSFFCAIGEAVNGPGGYFGWNLDALDDCLRGGWGATTPFVLHWDHSAGAREGLVERVPAGGGDMALFDLLLEIFEEQGVTVVLR